MSNQKKQSKMKRLVLFVAIAIASLTTFGQKGYTDFETVADVLVKTKVSHAKSNDTNTPLELSLYFQNAGTKNVIVRYEVFIKDSNGEMRHSGKKEVRVRPGQKQSGKLSGLTYELIGTNIHDYESGEKQWYFTLLEVKDAETGEVIATSEKTREE